MAFATGLAGPGEWIGVLGERVAAVLPPQSHELAARLWVALDQGAGFDDALDAVLREGLAGVPSLVLLESDAEQRLRLLVRGTPRVTVHLADGDHLEIVSGATTWTEQVVDGARGVAVELPGASTEGAAADPVVAGLRRLGSLTLGSLTLGSTSGGPVPVAVPDVLPVPDLVPEPTPEPTPEPAVPEVDEDGRPYAVPVKVKAAATVPPLPPVPPVPLAPPIPPLPPVPAPSPSLADALSDLGRSDPDHDDASDRETAPMVATPAWSSDATDATDVTDVLPPVPELDPADEGESEPVTDVLPAMPATVHDEVDPASFVPGLAHARPEPVARLTFSHGLVVDLEGPVVIGRAPSPDAGTTSGARTVTVPSPLAEVSANHAEIRPGAHPGQVEARDLGSTNGTVVLRRGQVPLDLVPGTPLVLPDHAVLDLGDGATVTVTLV